MFTGRNVFANEMLPAMDNESIWYTWVWAMAESVWQVDRQSLAAEYAQHLIFSRLNWHLFKFDKHFGSCIFMGSQDFNKQLNFIDSSGNLQHSRKQMETGQ